MSTAVYLGLKKKGISKAGERWCSVVGYSIDELRGHLEPLFSDGMSWENYGEWHIDHIIPKSFFSFTSPEDAAFKQCWALTNLQPLWAEDNLSKSNRLS